MARPDRSARLVGGPQSGAPPTPHAPEPTLGMQAPGFLTLVVGATRLRLGARRWPLRGATLRWGSLGCASPPGAGCCAALHPGIGAPDYGGVHLVHLRTRLVWRGRPAPANLAQTETSRPPEDDFTRIESKQPDPTPPEQCPPGAHEPKTPKVSRERAQSASARANTTSASNQDCIPSVGSGACGVDGVLAEAHQPIGRTCPGAPSG